MTATMIHPETGAILRRRQRSLHVSYRGAERTVTVEGWFPEGDGDGILEGQDLEPLEQALRQMKQEHGDDAA